ncbi:hypothetical protein [Nocardia cyriacigeorgica]|uniref:Uncharacterized protein n=1 Tax=Nocardia cyriacigeorgica TaxID=135487 RepID=A0A4U8W6D9_9NOCA|nr:hypothetical protein [Nocardia cyriacigeorgica]VFB00610.1 Uncharacterised protein [Nocardia cyriacigeorgica]
MNSSRGLLDGLDTAGIDIALREAACLGLAVDADTGRLELDLEVLTLPAQESTPADTKVRMTFHGVSRVAASLRIHRWDDVEPTVLPLELDGLGDAITSFGGGRLHGWEFIDIDDSSWSLWSELLSFDTMIDQRVSPHVLEFSQEEGLDPRELDVRVWFDSITIHDPRGKQIPLPEFIAGGRRWWEAHDAGDPRTRRSGIAPPL